MSLVAKLQRARDVLEQRGRLSIRALGRELGLGGEDLDELIEELVDVQRVAVREGNVLVGAALQGVEGAGRLGIRESNLVTPNPPSCTPKHLADRIRQSKSALEGERKQVTVLFADVKGSMELAEQLDPEEWSRIMNRFFQILAEGVERFEGFKGGVAGKVRREAMVQLAAIPSDEERLILATGRRACLLGLRRLAVRRPRSPTKRTCRHRSLSKAHLERLVEEAVVDAYK
jgi:hypothetical protein